MGQNTKILVVDDEQHIRFSLELLLKNEGYTVSLATNGQEAIMAYKEFAPEVILMDIMMPIMDGFEASASIRALDTHSRTSIIFLTAKSTSADKLKAYSKGADDFVVKPFDNEEILDKINQLSSLELD